MIDRPLDQARPEVPAELELERTGARQFDRPRHPQVLSGAGGEQRVAAIFVVEQHPEPGTPLGDAARGLNRQNLEGGNPRERRLVRRHLLELDAMIDGERHQPRVRPPSRGRPVDVVERRVLAKPGNLILKLKPTKEKQED